MCQSYLNALVKIGLEVTGVHDSIFDGMTTIDGEFKSGLLALAGPHSSISLALQGLLSKLLLASLVGGSLLSSSFGCHGLPLLSSRGFSRKTVKYEKMAEIGTSVPIEIT